MQRNFFFNSPTLPDTNFNGYINNSGQNNVNGDNNLHAIARAYFETNEKEEPPPKKRRQGEYLHNEVQTYTTDSYAQRDCPFNYNTPIIKPIPIRPARPSPIMIPGSSCHQEKQRKELNATPSQTKASCQLPFLWKEFNFHYLEAYFKEGGNIDAQDGHGETALMAAVEKTHTLMVEILLQNGASINIADNQGQTALHRAAYIGNISILRSLHRHGANWDAADSKGRTPITTILFYGNEDSTKFLSNEVIAPKTTAMSSFE